MTSKEEYLVRKYTEHTSVANRERIAANKALECLSECAPHRVGDVVKWVETNRRKNVGSTWHPKLEALPDREHKAIVTRIIPSVFEFKGETTVSYKYEFSPIKKDGGIANTSTYPRSGYEWTGEHIDI